ncbi:MAG: extracellular solute-binding protein [Streptosporangiales bacterium]|nr:extracellular solute-binding protein [Streptosporangiales bacterium]
MLSLFYHPQHLVGANLPKTLSKDDPVSWHQLAEYAGKTVEKKGGKRTRNGLQWELNVNIWSVLVLEPLVRQLGGEIYDEKAGKPLFTSPEVVQVMEFLRDLRFEHQAIDPAFYTPNNVVQYFAEDRLSMNVSGPYQPSLIEDTNPDAEYRAAPLPVMEGGERVTTVYSWAWFVNANADDKKQQAAWKFVDFLTKQGKLWWDEVRYPQARKLEVAGGKSINDYRTGTSPTFAVSLEDYEYGRYQFRSTDYYKVASALQRAQSRVLQGQDVKATLAKAQKEAEA